MEMQMTMPLRTKIIFLVCSLLLLGVLGASQASMGAQGAPTCTTTLSSGANVVTALTNVASGGTVCLNAGSYSYNATVNKGSMTTVTAAAGVDKTRVTFSAIDTG